MALKLWVEFFEDLQHVRGRSHNTVMAYRRDLELFEEFQKTGRDISSLFEFMKGKKLSTRTQARVISSLRTYFRFLETQGEKAPELRELRPPRIKPGLPKPLTLQEFESLLESCRVEDMHRSARNRITLLLLFGLGCRVSELVGLNLMDLSLSDSWLKVIGKGGKERLVPLTESLLQELKSYIKDVRGFLVKDDTKSILINDRGHRPSRVDVWRWLAAWSARAGFEEPVGPHQFRHGCATALLESGADLRTIQMLLGHSSLQTTQIYASVTSHKMREEVDRHHPLSGIPSVD
ncbi:MAG: tyrosine-type recombinase/integrase [Bdellovibrionales bacterium]